MPRAKKTRTSTRSRSRAKDTRGPKSRKRHTTTRKSRPLVGSTPGGSASTVKPATTIPTRGTATQPITMEQPVSTGSAAGAAMGGMTGEVSTAPTMPTAAPSVENPGATEIPAPDTGTTEEHKGPTPRRKRQR